MIRIEVEGQEAAIKGLEQAKKEFIERIEDDVFVLVDNISIKASNKANAFVDKGFLKNSIYKEVKGLNAEVGATVHYSPYVEFGTGGTVDVPQGLEDYAIQFKGAGIRQINLPARPFLFNSAFEELKILLDKYRKDGIIKGG